MNTPESHFTGREEENSAGNEVDDPALDVLNHQTTQSWTVCEDLATNGQEDHEFLVPEESNTEDNTFSDNKLDSCASDLDTSSDLSDLNSNNEADSEDFELSAEDLDLMHELGTVGNGDLASTPPQPHVDRIHDCFTSHWIRPRNTLAEHLRPHPLNVFIGTRHPT
ncbi:hypothetical protein PGT21_033407 [Puccinia graminis f. sp. tritici]|uniref:Uncharacterized protein n=1 Tax=Puccinia graminis f. sp. tritici TaxID=56615 RepID=A0A5B0N5X5_PUCGR|nr:hypothetical protein PGT21_033407 [Puccinia graminis f. sp. tritici]